MVRWQAPENLSQSITDIIIVIESLWRLGYLLQLFLWIHFFLEICGLKQTQATKVIHTRSPHAIFS